MDFSKYPDKYWHFGIKLASAKKYLIINDASLEYLYNNFLKPWCEDHEFSINGIIVSSSSEIEYFKIVQTPENLDYYLDAYKEISLFDSSDSDTRLFPLKEGKEYNIDHIYTSIIGGKKTKADLMKVFIVHGHNKDAKQKTSNFIKKNRAYTHNFT